MKKFYLYLLLFSFLLNFVWEVSQMPLFSSMDSYGNLENISSFVLIHWGTTLLDVAGILAVFSIIRFFKKNWPWTKGFNSGWAALLILLPAGQWIVEYYGVHVLHAWSYAPSMPLVFGVGILPLLQMLILPGASVLLVKKISGNSMK